MDNFLLLMRTPGPPYMCLTHRSVVPPEETGWIRGKPCSLRHLQLGLVMPRIGVGGGMTALRWRGRCQDARYSRPSFRKARNTESLSGPLLNPAAINCHSSCSPLEESFSASTLRAEASRRSTTSMREPRPASGFRMHPVHKRSSPYLLIQDRCSPPKE